MPESLVQAIDIFATITGVLYVYLEIKQSNLMWWLGIATGLACAVSFFFQGVYASCGLNIYYTIVSFWGLHMWRKQKSSYSKETAASSDSITLRHLGKRTVIVSIAGMAVLFALLYFGLTALGSSQTLLDSLATVISIVATLWLAKTYPQQWLLWIVADVISFVLCLKSGLPWMSALYLAYAISAVYGYFHWTRKGVYVD